MQASRQKYAAHILENPELPLACMLWNVRQWNCSAHYRTVNGQVLKVTEPVR